MTTKLDLRKVLKIPLDKYRYLYTNPKGHKIYGYRTKYTFFGKEFTTVVAYSDASYKKQMESYEKRTSKMLEKLADLKRRLESNRGKERDESSVEREVSGIIHKDFRAIIGYKIESDIRLARYQRVRKNPLLRTGSRIRS